MVDATIAPSAHTYVQTVEMRYLACTANTPSLCQGPGHTSGAGPLDVLAYYSHTGVETHVKVSR
jgi:hypothetical protein